MFQYQLYTHVTTSQSRQPQQQLVNADDFDEAREEFHHERAAVTQQFPYMSHVDDNQEQALIAPSYKAAAEVSFLSACMLDRACTLRMYDVCLLS